MNQTASPASGVINKYPAGFRPRRGLNWVVLGLTYASFYMCRYNFRFATPGLVQEFGLTKLQITSILSAWSVAYGVGQLVNGLLTDRIGGRTAMMIGAVGTIIVNLFFGFASFTGTFSTFALIWLINGYLQSFGAPGMIKINAAWFNRNERGSFAGIFGFMIQLGQIAINNLGPLILAGFAIGTWVVAKDEWRWLFRIPPIFTVLMAVLLAIFARESPEQAGYPGVVRDELDAGDTRVRVSIKESFITIFTHPLVWFYAVAYACTGAVRNSSDQLAILYFSEQLHLNMHDQPAAVAWTLNLMPLVAVMGSLGSGIISDKLFKGHRSPVAMSLYFLETCVILCAAAVILSGVVGPTPGGIFLGCLFLVMISLTANSTHSIVGAAAPMDIGGRKMAGFAAGVIDSFQYFGSAIALPITGKLLDKFGWGAWYPIMAGFGLIGGFTMLLVTRKQKQLASRAAANPVSSNGMKVQMDSTKKN